MGVAYHAHYLDWFEAARTEMVRTLGLPYRQLEALGIFMPVVAATVRYHRPAYYDDLLEIHVRIPEPPRARIRFAYLVFREGETEALASGEVVLCFLDRNRLRPIPAPEIVRQLWAHYATDPR
jgi:acyl-CoA thioester hydrolase